MLRSSSSVLPACEAAAPSARGCPKHMDVPASNVLHWTPGACRSPQWHSCISLKDSHGTKSPNHFILDCLTALEDKILRDQAPWGTTGRYEKSSQLLLAFQDSTPVHSELQTRLPTKDGVAALLADPLLPPQEPGTAQVLQPSHLTLSWISQAQRGCPAENGTDGQPGPCPEHGGSPAPTFTG